MKSRGIRIHPVKGGSTLTAKEYKDIYELAENDANKKRQGNHRSRMKDTTELMIKLLYRGLSGSEVVNLNIEDLPFSHHENKINVYNYWNGKLREVFLLSPLETKLNEYVERYRQDAKPNDPLFVSRLGNRTSLYILWQKLNGNQRSTFGQGISEKLGTQSLGYGIFRRTEKVQLVGRDPSYKKENILSQKVRGITLDDFILKHLQGNFDNSDVAELKKRIQNAHYNGPIDLPKPIGESGRGRHTYYDVIELRRRWPGYRNKFPDWPKLISARKVKF